MKRVILATLLAVNLAVIVGTNWLAVRDEGTVTAPEDQVQGGRSGFWTSRAPSQGGAYRWRLLGLGVAIASITGYALVRVIQRASSQNKAQALPTARATAPTSDAMPKRSV